MRVICCYLELEPATKFCLTYQVDRRQLEVEFVEIPPTNPDAYFEAVEREWARGEGFITVEGDVVPWPGALEEIANCHNGLCNFWGPSGWNMDHYSIGYGMGCTKFGTSLIHSHPNMLQEIVEKGKGRRWDYIDGQIFDYLLQHGEGMHFHSPGVSHINRRRYPQ